MVRGTYKKRDISTRTPRVFVISLVNDNGSPRGEFFQKPVNLLPVGQSARRVIGVADIDESGLRINGSKHRFQIVAIVMPQIRRDYFCADRDGVAFNQFESRISDDQLATVLQKNIHCHLYDRGRSGPKEDLFRLHLVMAGESGDRESTRLNSSHV